MPFISLISDQETTIYGPEYIPGHCGDQAYHDALYKEYGVQISSWQHLITGERHELPHAVAWLGRSSDLHASSMRRGSPTREFAALGYFME